MEWIIPMIAGLLLDICGAFLIAQGFRMRRKFSWEIDTVDNWTDLEELRDQYYHATIHEKPVLDRIIEQETLLVIEVNSFRYGFSFLFSGFMLQIISNIINYYNL